MTTQPPTNATINEPFDVQLTAEDANGKVDSAFSGPVTLSLADNPGNSTLGGTLTVNVENGVADFRDLTLDMAGSGYTLQADAIDAVSATTSTFDVNDFELTSATEPDPSHVLVTYIVDATAIQDPISLDIYRDASPDSPDPSNLLAATVISDPQDLQQGVHQVDLSLNGGVLSIDPSREFVDIVANPDSDGQPIDAYHEVYFQKFVLGVVTQGFEPFATAPEWLSQMQTGLQNDGYNRVIAFDWSAESLLPVPGVTTLEGLLLKQQVVSAADSLVNQSDVALGSVVDLDFIGHSRGAVVISQAMQDLVSVTDPALVGSFKDMTLLDPHPANSSDDFFSDNSSNPLSWLAEHYYFAFVLADSDPQVVIPSNVNQVDVYYQQSSYSDFPLLSTESVLNLWGDLRDISNPSGVPISTLPPLTDGTLQDGSVIGHSEVPLWYLENVVPTLDPGVDPPPPLQASATPLGPPPTAAAVDAFLYPQFVTDPSLAQSLADQFATAWRRSFRRRCDRRH